jgi:TraM recognition site of TraD and TraG
LFIPIVQALGYDPENIYIWVPGEDTSQIYNPVEHAIGDLADVQAEQQYENSRPVGAKPDEFFSDAAKLFLSASMCMSNAISNQHGIPFGFLLIKAIGGLNSIVKRLEYNKERLREVDFWAYDKFAQLIATGTSEKTVDSTRGAMGNMVGKLSTGVLRSMVGKTSFPLYLDGPKLLIIGCRSQLCPVVAPYLMSCLKTVVQVNAVHGRQTPIQIAFDELPKMDYKSLPEDVNELRKFGVYFNVAAQTPMQLKKRYGNEGLGALMTGFGHSGWYSTGIAEKEASEYLEHILGKEKYREKQYSSGYSGGKSNNSTSNPIKERPLMPAHEIRKMPPQNLIWLSPGFSKTNGSTWDAQIKEVGIPWKTKIQVDPHYAAMVEMAAAEWPFVEAQLKKYSPQVSIEELQGYLVEAERIAAEYFALPPSEEELAEQSAIEDAAKEIDDFYASLNSESSMVFFQGPDMKQLEDANALRQMAELASDASDKTISPEDVENLLPFLRQIFEGFELVDQDKVMQLTTASILTLIDLESKDDAVEAMREVVQSELVKADLKETLSQDSESDSTPV